MQDGSQLPFRSRPLNSIQSQTATLQSQSAKDRLILRLCTERWQVLAAKRKRLRKEVVSKWLQLWKTGARTKQRVREALRRAATLADYGSREPSDRERAEREVSRRLQTERLGVEVQRMKDEMERRRRVAREAAWAAASAEEVTSEVDLQRIASEALDHVGDDDEEDMQTRPDAVVQRSEEVEDMDVD